MEKKDLVITKKNANEKVKLKPKVLLLTDVIDKEIKSISRKKSKKRILFKYFKFLKN